MNLSGPFIRRPIGTALLAIGLFMVGVICYLQLGVSALPNIQIPVIFVHASQSGADATTMASTVTAPLERHLGQLPGGDGVQVVVQRHPAGALAHLGDVFLVDLSDDP